MLKMYLVLQAVFILAMVTLNMCEEDIQVECRNDSIIVTWKVSKDLAETPSRLFLGDCFPSKFELKSNGGEAFFYYRLADCHFRQKRTQKKLIYENELTFRPLPKPNSPLFVYPIQCVFQRPDDLHQFVKPAIGVWQGQGELTFHMGLLNDDLSGPALSNIFQLGSFINIWAEVEQQTHQPLMLFLEECTASNRPILESESWMYPIINNKGCFVDGKSGHSRFLPRPQTSVILVQLQTLKFLLEQEVYIHCKLVVWDPRDLNEHKKACNYNKLSSSWELLDDVSQNDLCNCCDYGCTQRKTRDLYTGQAQRSVLGPLIITESSSDFKDSGLFE